MRCVCVCVFSTAIHADYCPQCNSLPFFSFSTIFVTGLCPPMHAHLCINLHFLEHLLSNPALSLVNSVIQQTHLKVFSFSHLR